MRCTSSTIDGTRNGACSGAPIDTSSHGGGLAAARRPDPAAAADAALLERRLRQAGLPPSIAVAVQENRRVLAHVRDGRLRIHRGYAYAPDRVLDAAVRFAQGGSRTALRRVRQELVSFPVHDYVPGPSRSLPAPRRGDQAILDRLRAMHGAFNAERFDGILTTPVLRVSHRMIRRLGETIAQGRICTIVIGRRHVERDGWTAVQATLLHEMVHQWQAESGLSLDHGPSFRRKALAVGAEPRARRCLHRDPDGEHSGG